ncbi:hypothetical protein GCM10009817_09360 [Terrabacter lapilli]|uniref:Lipoprotein n=1 Tax=Terrabacter lapilli TaxID=436231 RepID=A0ABP5D2M0_9MICO
MILAKGKTIWSGWALTLASCAVGCVLVAVIAWSFPGPPIGPIVLAVALVLIVTASRLYVRIESDGLSLPVVCAGKRSFEPTGAAPAADPDAVTRLRPSARVHIERWRHGWFRMLVAGNAGSGVAAVTQRVPRDRGDA